ncbi:M23 family metallopeptidase [Thermanaeromonas sp. C210]|uniref:M23 family metallopeptidase n=1 Tax=Thermanaeromonas sp. C210 TaxID=2731925 RepID=UPI00155BE270|nr:M23 family metallopeptidase [Thermanaeromonas sp. C210]GFN22591.1 peptidase M23 [Thermanaeromonas sp. C210]
MRYDWDWDDFKGAPLGEFKGPGRALPPSRFSRQLLKQTLAAGLLFLAITLVFRLEGEGAGQLQAALRYYLRDPSSDQTWQVGQVMRNALWLDAFDRWVFHDFQGEQDSLPAFRPQEQRDYPPMAVPVSGEIIKPYGWLPAEEGQPQQFHKGIDIKAAGDSPVRAVMDGRVIRAGEDPILVRVVEIDHGGGLVTVYGTLGKIYVRPGQTVKQGDTIAVLASGSTVQLHFEVRENGQAVDPMLYLAPAEKI